MKNNIAWIVMFFLLGSCQQYKTAEMDNADSVSALDALVKNQNAMPADLYADGKAKLIKTAHYRFEVENVKKSTEAIELAIKKFPAYISSSNLHLENPILESKITIRVQGEYFQDLLKEIDLQAVYVNFRDVVSDDVSKEFVDLESRIKTKREVEERYMEILRNKAGTLKEILEAEHEIGSIHEEIEATVGKLNYLKDQVHYSSINLEFYQTLAHNSMARTETPLPGRFSDAFTSGLNGLINFAVALVYLWPVAILCAMAFMIFRVRKKKMLRMKSA